MVRNGSTVATIDGVILEPFTAESATERASRTGNDSDARDPRRSLVGARPPLVGDTVINCPGVHQIVVDDRITIGDVTWRATGAGQIWLDRTKVPVTKMATIA